jgi:hypothetical protein
MTTAVMGDAAIAALRQKQHLIVPGIRAQGPPVAEDHGLSRTPILVVNLRAVFGRDRRHNVTPDEVMDLKNLEKWRSQLGSLYGPNPKSLCRQNRQPNKQSQNKELGD